MCRRKIGDSAVEICYTEKAGTDWAKVLSRQDEGETDGAIS